MPCLSLPVRAGLQHYPQLFRCTRRSKLRTSTLLRHLPRVKLCHSYQAKELIGPVEFISLCLLMNIDMFILKSQQISLCNCISGNYFFVLYFLLFYLSGGLLSVCSLQTLNITPASPLCHLLFVKEKSWMWCI
jgi:hypothetical protein